MKPEPPEEVLLPIGWLVVMSVGPNPKRVIPLYLSQTIALDGDTEVSGELGWGHIPYASFRRKLRGGTQRLRMDFAASPHAVHFYGYRLKFFSSEEAAAAFIPVLPDDETMLPPV